jgi:hypothetical protein
MTITHALGSNTVAEHSRVASVLAQGPIEEALSYVAGPQGSIAIEGHDARPKREDRIEELVCEEMEVLRLGRLHRLTITR